MNKNKNENESTTSASASAGTAERLAEVYRKMRLRTIHDGVEATMEKLGGSWSNDEDILAAFDLYMEQRFGKFPLVQQAIGRIAASTDTARDNP